MNLNGVDTDRAQHDFKEAIFDLLPADFNACASLMKPSSSTKLDMPEEHPYYRASTKTALLSAANVETEYGKSLQAENSGGL